MESLYYEIHITLDPCFSQLSKIQEIARVYKFKIANLLMVKNDGTEEEFVKDMFFTSRTKTYAQAEERVKEFCKMMKLIDVGIRRFKVEDTVLDSRMNDTLGLIDSLVVG